MEWEKVMIEIECEFPDILPNPFQFLYVGTNEDLFDLNTETEIEPEEESEQDSEEDIDQRLIDIALGEVMLRSLPAKRRIIVEMRLCHEMSFSDIGRKLGMSRQLVFYHYSMSIEFLKKKYRS
jgi:RNA polymerase sigma factor (sigma-70 family)